MRFGILVIVAMAISAPAAAQSAPNSRCAEFATMLRQKADDADAFRKNARFMALNLGAYDPAKDFQGGELAALQSLAQVAEPMSEAADEYATRLDIAATMMEACAAKTP